jgi:hypothetical protein
MANDKSTPPKKTTTTTPASATARTTERRKERERARSRTQIITIVVIVAAIVGVIILGIISANRPAETPIPPETTARFDGIEQGRTTDGFPRLGDADAPIKVSLYNAVDCVECAPFYEGVIDGLLEHVRNEEIALIAVPMYGGAGALSNGQGAARVAVCAADYNKFWEMQDALFHWQQYGNQAFIHSRLVNGAGALGMDTNAITGCSLGTAPDGVLNEARSQTRELINFSQPPAIAINGVIVTRDQEVEADGETTVIIVAETDPQAALAAVASAVANLGGNNDENAADATPEVEATIAADTTPEAEATADIVQSDTTAEAELMPTVEATAES